MICQQTQCVFNSKNGLDMLCPYCSDCGAESNIINENCVNCWNCLKDEGYIRTGRPKIHADKEVEKGTEIVCQYNTLKSER